MELRKRETERDKKKMRERERGYDFVIGTAERVDLFDRRRRSRIRESGRTQTAADAVPSPVIEAEAAARGWIQSFSNHSKGVSGLTDDDDAMSIEKRRNKDNKTVIRPRKRKTRGSKENG